MNQYWFTLIQCTHTLACIEKIELSFLLCGEQNHISTYISALTFNVMLETFSSFVFAKVMRSLVQCLEESLKKI